MLKILEVSWHDYLKMLQNLKKPAISYDEFKSLQKTGRLEEYLEIKPDNNIQLVSKEYLSPKLKTDPKDALFLFEPFPFRKTLSEEEYIRRKRLFHALRNFALKRGISGSVEGVQSMLKGSNYILKKSKSDKIENDNTSTDKYCISKYTKEDVQFVFEDIPLNKFLSPDEFTRRRRIMSYLNYRFKRDYNFPLTFVLMRQFLKNDQILFEVEDSNKINKESKTNYKPKQKTEKKDVIKKSTFKEEFLKFLISIVESLIKKIDRGLCQ